MKFKKTSGFSLLEMLIVTSVLAVAGQFGMKMLERAIQSSADIKAKSAINDVESNIGSMLSFSQVCLANFQNQSVNNISSTPITVTSIVTPLPVTTTVFTTSGPNNKYEGGHVLLRSMSLQEDPANPIVATAATINLHVVMDKTHDTGTIEQVTRRIPISIGLDDMTNRRIISCAASAAGGGGTSQKGCEEMGGRFVSGSPSTNSRCIFRKFLTGNDPLFDSSPAIMHVQASTNDRLIVTEQGTVSLNYPVGSIPTNAGSRLFVNGNKKVNRRFFSNRVMTEQVILAETLADTTTDPYLTTPQGALVTKKNTGASSRYVGMLAPNGDLWMDGGPSSIALVASTYPWVNTFYHNGFTFHWSNDLTASPLPRTSDKGTPMMALRHDGRVGINFTSKMGESPAIHPHTCPYNPPDTWPACIAGHPCVQPVAECSGPNANYDRSLLLVNDGMLVNGNAFLGETIVANPFTNISDRRHKKNIRTLKNSLAKVEAIQGYSYLWKKDSPLYEHHPGRDIGFIAQDVEKVLPDLVVTDPMGYKSLNYSKMIAVLWQGLKDDTPKEQRTDQRLSRLEALACRDNPLLEMCSRSGVNK
jgi:prepilin-type N-terminal cleavage/methylation domain-containing protein